MKQFDIETYRQIEEHGFALTSPILPERLLDRLTKSTSAVERDARGGLRDLFGRVPETRELPRHPLVRQAVEAVLGPGAFAVRGTLFDKTPDANWNVAWHQDVTIPVAERRDAPGFGPWSVKAGIVHVQPPAGVLDGMLAVRLHLDPCGPENGPLGVLPGSHRHGRLDSRSVDDWVARSSAVECHLERGGLLLMRPLLLHASSRAVAPDHRRVIHLEFAAGPLPDGLEWHEAIQ